MDDGYLEETVFGGDMVYWKVRHEYGGFAGDRRDEVTYMDIKVSVNTQELLGKLRENLKKHKQQYTEASVSYANNCIKELKEKLEKLGRGEEVDMNTRLTKPRSYASEYEQAIEMFAMHKGNEVEIRSSDFAKLIQDKWDWKRDFGGSYLANTGKALD